jgi:carboxyl-terminal processing protease
MNGSFLRLAIASLTALWLAAPAHAQQAFITQQQRTQDFTEFCDFVREQYAYFDIKKTNWDSTCSTYAPKAAAAADRDAFIGVLERAMAELYDHHAHLGTNTKTSPRLVPTTSQIAGEWRDGRVFIVAVRAGSPADQAGVKPGARVLMVDGESILTSAAAIEPQLLTAPDPAARDWALEVALAGHRERDTVQLSITDSSGTHAISYAPISTAPAATLLSHKIIGDVGYVRFNNSLGNNDLVKEFDAALATMRAAHGIVIDLRDTASGGVSSVARGMMGRFVNATVPYQRHELISEFRDTGIRRIWVEYVAPREPFMSQPVVVLAGRWTGSMGEGIAIGFNAIREAPVLGEPMAHLLGALGEVSLHNSGIPVRVPAEKLFQINGKPREAFIPCRVAPTRRATGDIELDAAVKLADEMATANGKLPANWHCAEH